MSKNTITINVSIEKPIETVWKCWNTPSDIEKWNAASKDWHTINAKNDIRNGGSFSYRMEAKDGSVGFDCNGIYTKVIDYKLIEYTMEDDRKASVCFLELGNKTEIMETFELENENSVELQRNGWQSILDNFKKHVELKQ